MFYRKKSGDCKRLIVLQNTPVTAYEITLGAMLININSDSISVDSATICMTPQALIVKITP